MLFSNSNKCMDKLPAYSYDEACVDILNKLGESVSIFGQYKECHNCDFIKYTTLGANDSTSVLFNTNYPVTLYFVRNNIAECNFSKTLFEHYRYGWNVTEGCPPLYIKEAADNAYLPILSAFIVLFCFGTIWYLIKCLYRCSGRIISYLPFRNADLQEDLGTSSSPLVIERTPSIRKHPNRVKSIDIFRGLCIVLMIFVNYGGGKYYFFKHSIWNGLTVADLVFPWFMWLMGLSMAISLQKKLRSGVPRRLLIFQILRRSFILILIGIVINSNHNRQTIASLRFPGILQRLGITYLIVGLLEVAFAKRLEIGDATLFKDITSAWPQYIFVGSLLAIHACVTFLVNVPGCGKGYLGPGGLDDGGKFFNCTGGAAGYIDREVFGEHMYKWNATTFHKMYETTQNYDPEGLLGILTSVFVVYMGVQAGRTLNTYQNVKAKVIRWTLWSIVIGLIGAGLAGFSSNNGVIPINKNLWSLSFVFILSGMAFIIFSFLFILVDIERKWGGRPLFYPGMNSIFLYIGHELFKKTFPFSWDPVYETHGTYLFMNLWGTALWVAISIFMYKNNVFFSL